MSKRCLFFIVAAVNALWLLSCPVPFFGHFGSYQATNGMMAELMGRDGWASFLQPRTFVVMQGVPALHLLYYPFGAFFARIVQIVLGLSDHAIPLLGKLQAVVWMNAAAFVFARILGSFSGLKSEWRFAGVACFYLTPMLMIEGSAFRNEAFTFFISLWAVERLLHPSLFSLGLAGFFYGLSVVSRVHFGSLILVHLLIILRRQSPGRFQRLFIWGFFAALPLILWLGYFRWLESQGMPVSTSIFSQAEEGRFLIFKLLFSFPFFVHLLKQTFFYLLNPVIALAAIAGIFLSSRAVSEKLPESRAPGYVRVWFFAALAVIVALPRKVLDHPFYLMPVIPPLLIFVIFLFNRLVIRQNTFVSRPLKWLPAVCLAAAVCVSWNPLMKNPPEAPLWLKRAQKIENLTQAGDIVVLQHPQPASLIYYTHRLGWEFDFNMAQSKIMTSPQERHRVMVGQGYGDPVKWLRHLTAQGADYFFVSDFDLFFNSPVAYNFEEMGIQPFYQDEDWLGFNLEKLKAEATA